MQNRDVLISGAGVSGPALAYWLRRLGFNPVVVERAPAPRDGGQAVDLRGAAIEVARRTGILDTVRAARTGTRGMSYVDSAGKRLATLDGAFGVIDPQDVEIVRGDLVRILYEATRNDVEYIFDDSISGLTDAGDGVAVTFERSAPRTFHLVVGTDGLHSRVRGLVFGPESRFVREAPDFYLDPVGQVRMDSWSSGRVALAGDAGYCPSPLSGQGSSLALVGSYVLASELSAADGNHRAAFAGYQQRMADFVVRNQQIAIGNAKRFIPTSRRQIWLQNQGIRVMPYMPGKNWILSLATKGVKEAANAITLPDPAQPSQPQP